MSAQDLFTVKQLSELFGMHHVGVSSRIVHLTPDDVVHGTKMYKLNRVACYLCDIDDAMIERWLLKVKPNSLPVALNKAYWQAQRLKQDFDLRDGALWETIQVQQKVTSLFMLIRQHLRMMSDNIERRTELNDIQRELIKSSMDGLLQDLQIAVIENFSHKNRPMEVDETMIEEEDIYT
jgi:hypothetical protein